MSFASAFAWFRKMSAKVARRSPSPTPSESRAVKRRKLEYPPLTPDDYRNGVMLAPMVRSGALPTRLFALKHGAKLVWGPEIVDKAVLHTKRQVDPVTGVVSFVGVSKPIFTTHPIEKPFLIYQMGSADPELAVQAARMVMNDVSGIDLNCGCPKPFSTHAGMGAALLTNPDLLCSILTALRQALPPEISVSAKIRLLPNQEDTYKLIERIVNTGISCLTVHCRTRNMRPRERALIERMNGIVKFVEGLGKDVAIIQNGDCTGYEDAKRIRGITGAHSVMIATAAEANPTCFSPRPLTDLHQTFVPSYIRLCRFINNHWSSTKFCSGQFSGSHVVGTRADQTVLRKAISEGKGYEDVDALVAPWTGAEEFDAIVRAIEARDGRRDPVLDLDEPAPAPAVAAAAPAKAEAEAASPSVTIATESAEQDAEGAAAAREQSQASASQSSVTLSQASSLDMEAFKTPVTGGSPDPALLRAPLGPANEARMPVPALVSGKDVPTPTPSQVHSPEGP